MSNRVTTVGAFIAPLEIEHPDGSTEWVWQVTEFFDDCFCNGNNISVNEVADTSAGLIKQDDICQKCEHLGETTCSDSVRDCQEGR